jgi:transcriptional regulator with XRE-family HTH domain
MTLQDFMKWKGLGDAKVAKGISVSRVSVTRYRNGRRRPDWEVLLRIYHWSGRIVTPNDFLVMPQDRQKRRAA